MTENRQKSHKQTWTLIGKIGAEFPDTPVIIVTSSDEVDKAVACMKNGAFDYIVKPANFERLTASLTRALELNRLKRENRELRQRLLSDGIENPNAFAGIVTRNRQMLSVFKYAEVVAASLEPVLIYGETGVGKELLAQSIHALCGRSGPMVAVNVSGLDDHMFSDTLFGHAKGAFTNADKSRAGLIESAEGGTLFLDEVGDLSPASQLKLLRLIQEHEYLPLGDDKTKTADIRVLAATNRDLSELCQKGGFRKDLMYRLDIHRVFIPPLRERTEDIPLLVDHFLKEAADKLNKKAPTPPPELYTLLKTWPFYGNVRELRSMVYNAVSEHESHVLSLSLFRKRMKMKRSEDGPAILGCGIDGLFALTHELPTIKQVTNALIEEAMRRADGKQSVAAGLLGISAAALNKRLKKEKKQANGKSGNLTKSKV